MTPFRSLLPSSSSNEEGRTAMARPSVWSYCPVLSVVQCRVNRRSTSGGSTARVNRPFLASSVGRSEEHTSELQSLLRRSSSVLCLKTRHKRQATYAEQHEYYRRTK